MGEDFVSCWSNRLLLCTNCKQLPVEFSQEPREDIPQPRKSAVATHW